MKAIDDQRSRLWGLCRIGLTYKKKTIEYPIDLSVSPDGTSSIGGGLMFADVSSSGSATQAPAIINNLRELEVLSSQNIGDLRKGVLQSDTGEVTLRTDTGGELDLLARLRSPWLRFP